MSLLPLALRAALARIDTRAVPVSLLRDCEEDAMSRHHATPSRVKTLDELEDAHDLRAVIAAALDATPMDEEALRRGVWTYVTAEHDLGTPPAAVIVTLTELVDAPPARPPLVQQALVRRVILWCVEAYFGHLGGDVIGGYGALAGDDAPERPPRISSNR